MQGYFCNNYVPKIEFFKNMIWSLRIAKKKTPLGHPLNETQFPSSSSTNFLKRKTKEDFPLFMDKTVFAMAQEL